MLIYRVETRFSDIETQTSGSPYGRLYMPIDTRIWVRENGIAFDTVTHDMNDPTLYNRCPIVKQDYVLRERLAKHLGYEDYSYVVWSNADYEKLSEFRFAFESPVAVCNWFTKEEREQLKDRGFYIAVYNVPDGDVLLGSKQLLYKPEAARQVDCIYF